ncbi:MAG: hypothetical protein QXK74_06155 [Candidatus Nitrosocaldaceae archaeon]
MNYYYDILKTFEEILYTLAKGDNYECEDIEDKNIKTLYKSLTTELCFSFSEELSKALKSIDYTVRVSNKEAKLEYDESQFNDVSYKYYDTISNLINTFIHSHKYSIQIYYTYVKLMKCLPRSYKVKLKVDELWTSSNCTYTIYNLFELNEFIKKAFESINNIEYIVNICNTKKKLNDEICNYIIQNNDKTKDEIINTLSQTYKIQDKNSLNIFLDILRTLTCIKMNSENVNTILCKLFYNHKIFEIITACKILDRWIPCIPNVTIMDESGKEKISEIDILVPIIHNDEINKLKIIEVTTRDKVNNKMIQLKNNIENFKDIGFETSIIFISHKRIETNNYPLLTFDKLDKNIISSIYSDV